MFVLNGLMSLTTQWAALHYGSQGDDFYGARNMNGILMSTNGIKDGDSANSISQP